MKTCPKIETNMGIEVVNFMHCFNLMSLIYIYNCSQLIEESLSENPYEMGSHREAVREGCLE